MRVGDKLNKFKQKRDEEIEKFLREGCTYLRVATLVGCSIGQVQYIAKLKGLLKRAQQMDPVEEGTGTGLSAQELCILTGDVIVQEPDHILECQCKSCMGEN